MFTNLTYDIMSDFGTGRRNHCIQYMFIIVFGIDYLHTFICSLL